MSGRLIISPLPDRKGWWLSQEVPGGVRALAKFRSEEAAEAFAEWCKAHVGIKDERNDQCGSSN